MKTSTKRALLGGAMVLVLAAFALAAASCAKKAADAGKIAGQYEIAYGGAVCGSPISIAALNGYYADEGLDIDLVSGVSFEVIRSYLASGKMPVINGDFQFFPSIHEGVDVKLIAGLHEGCIKILVPNDSSIQNAADLKGCADCAIHGESTSRKTNHEKTRKRHGIAVSFRVVSVPSVV
jgi:NitT/TauT family transport system substrate-binding protein